MYSIVYRDLQFYYEFNCIATLVFFLSSQPRYWFLLLLTLVLNILVIVGYSDPNNMEEGRVQVIRNLDENSTITNPNVKKPLAIAIYVLGGLHLLLAIWMVMEYFIVTWPHFVLPEFLYRIRFKHFDLSAFLIRYVGISFEIIILILFTYVVNFTVSCY